jgi:predicted ATPase
MLQHIQFSAGAAKGKEPLAVAAVPSITIFVGPNNSGKSQALQDLATILISGKPKSTAPVISDVQFKEFTVEEVEKLVEDTTISTSHRGGLEHRTLLAPIGENIQVDTDNFRGGLLNPNNPMTRLLVNDQKRARLREIIHDAVGLYLALDCTQDQRVSARFSKTPPPDERNLTDELFDYMRAAQSHDKVSDGVKAFVGILLQVHAGEPDVVLIDEPEAFLHPSLAYTLGREIAHGASDGRKFVFAATHSPHFLMGAVASGAKVNVIRLTYDGDEGTARILPNEDLVRMMRDPLLRSVGVLEGLFHANVIVTEADADRAFYQEINNRLSTAGDPRAIVHALFLNANGIHTIPRIVGPLRRLGISASQIVDVDFFGVTGTQIAEHLEAICIPQSEKHSYRQRMQSVHSTLTAACLQLDGSASSEPRQSYKTLGGVRLLRNSELEAAENLSHEFARYGVFIVPHGEVENWLEKLHIDRSKQKWLRRIFEKMGEEPANEEYVRPDSGDVWDFVGNIKRWLSDPARRGIN